MAFYRRWLLVLFALILSSGSLSAASTKEQRAYTAAVSAFQDEMWNRAETEFAQFTQKYPKSTNAPEAVLLQAQAQFKQGKFTTAIALLADTNHLAKAGTLADQYVYWIGEGRFQNHDLTGAAETFVSLARDFPDSSLRLRAVIEAAAARAQLGQWPQITQLFEETNGVFQRVAQMDPANELVSRGQLLFAQAKFEQNEFGAAANILAALNPQTLPPQLDWRRAYLLCQVELAAADTNAALAAATNLLQIADLVPDDNLRAESVSVRADILEKLGRLAEAEAAYQENLTTNAPDEHQRQAVLKIAELADAQNQFSDAEMNLDEFIAQFTNSPSADIALLTLGELHLKDHAALPAETNHLQAAQAKFNQFLGMFTNSATAGLAGRACLDRGWCEWLAGDMTNSLADFEAAVKLMQSLPPSEDLAVALFKTGDAMFAQMDYAGALENYQAVLDDFTNVPSVAVALGDRALYQSLRANLQLTNYDGASNALAQILRQFPASNLATNSVLLYGESQAAANEMSARAVFQQFLAQFPGSQLRPEAEFAIARTYELETNWPAAIAGYQGWLDHFPTNQSRAQTLYALARVNSHAGNKTNAFGLFTNLVTQFPASDLAPQAQWWVADYFFNEADYVDAERNYKLLYQNTNWQGSPLVYHARMMAGRAAVARQGYSDAIDYFSKLEADTNCLMDLRVQATLAHGNALMREESPDTNSPLANFQIAIKVFGQIAQWDPTNQLVARAMIGIGDCNLQLTNYDDATNAFAQVVSSTNASVSARSEAQIGIGITLEKMADLASDAAQNGLLDEALGNYRDVFDQLNLRDGEEPDPFWQKEAGLREAPLVGRLNDVKSERLFYGSLKEALPQLSDLIDKKIAALPPETK
jgi:TolA-binding protein